MKTAFAISLALGLSSTPALAQTAAPVGSPQTERPLIERLINTPFVQNWNTWGLSLKSHTIQG